MVVTGMDIFLLEHFVVEHIMQYIDKMPADKMPMDKMSVKNGPRSCRHKSVGKGPVGKCPGFQKKSLCKNLK